MTSLLRRVRTRISIHAHRKARGLLDGEYTSVFHGRSLEFDDLRPYVPGDELKDVDWKATARLGSLMTRRYVASRKHTIVLVVDTGRTMAATARGGEPKSELAIIAAGAMGYVAQRHGDLVALVAGDSAGTRYLKPQSTEAHLERILQSIQQHTTTDAPTSDLSRQLAFVASAFTRGRILVVVSDDRELGEREIATLKRLVVRHEVLWITIGDADLMREDLAERRMADIDSSFELPAFVREDARLRAEFESSVAVQTAEREDLFDSLAISSTRVTTEADVIPGLYRLLELHRSSKRLGDARR